MSYENYDPNKIDEMTAAADGLKADLRARQVPVAFTLEVFCLDGKGQDFIQVFLRRGTKKDLPRRRMGIRVRYYELEPIPRKSLAEPRGEMDEDEFIDFLLDRETPLMHLRWPDESEGESGIQVCLKQSRKAKCELPRSLGKYHCNYFRSKLMR